MPLAMTRALLAAALDGRLAQAPFRRESYFGLSIPLAAPGVDSRLLDPATAWASRRAYGDAARRLVAMFRENVVPFADMVDGDVRNAAPRRTAA
jgi:phosphoenolpyruvate carboxykinase (ATP)